MKDVEERLSELRTRLLHYRADRHPREHATTQFHLGTTLIEAGRFEQAEAALRTAAKMFDPEDSPVEHATAINMLGVTLREDGRPGEAAEHFTRAAELFGANDKRLEQGAALYNRGLVCHATGETEDAATCFTRALEIFDDARQRSRASAAARELGATLLATNRLAEATDALERATELARRADDHPALGAAANALGLARLGTGDAEGAVEALRTAVGANPRTIRPDGYAMAQANLALAYEEAGDPPRARLAAQQALAMPEAAPAVTDQAKDLLDRLGRSPEDVLVVFDDLPQAQWPPVEARAELIRLVDTDGDERRTHAGAWIDGQLARGGDGPALAAAWLEMLLELPTESMTTLVRSTLQALADRDAETREKFRSQVSRAMVRFHIPQWKRTQEIFESLAEEVGLDETSWS